MVSLDRANNRLVKKTMVWASAGMSQSWQLRAVNRRPRHAKRLWDLPVVR
jgi:DNA polymerase V